jgi:hypothetical protein
MTKKASPSAMDGPVTLVQLLNIRKNSKTQIKLNQKYFKKRYLKIKKIHCVNIRDYLLYLINIM